MDLTHSGWSDIFFLGMDFPEGARVLNVEMSMGQMVEDIERCVQGKKPVHWFGKCGGDVPTPEEVVDFINTLL